MAAFYAVYHGPDGLKRIATRVHQMASITADAFVAAGYPLTKMGTNKAFFDTFTVDVSKFAGGAKGAAKAAADHGVNVRIINDSTIGIAFGEYFDTCSRVLQ
jgi:glycine dehydrogenase